MSALSNLYDMGQEDRRKMGLAGHKHAMKNFSFPEFGKRWVDLMLKVNKEYGSWSNRSGYSNIICTEIK